MLRADSRAEPVDRYTRVASASPATVAEATCTELVRKKGVNSGVRKSCP